MRFPDLYLAMGYAYVIATSTREPDVTTAATTFAKQYTIIRINTTHTD